MTEKKKAEDEDVWGELILKDLKEVLKPDLGRG